MRKLMCLIVFSILLLSSTFSQDNLDIVFGYQRQYYNAIELGVAVSERDELKTYKNFHICGEFLFGHQEPGLLGLKTGFDYSYVIFLFSGQAAYYFNKNDETFLLRPEVGFTLFGFADLTYGYNVFFVRENLNLVNNVISIRFKIPLALYN